MEQYFVVFFNSTKESILWLLAGLNGVYRPLRIVLVEAGGCLELIMRKKDLLPKPLTDEYTSL